VTERLQKFLARAGVASRRAAEGLIVAGRVRVNNRTVTELGTQVRAGEDLVTVDGKLVEAPSGHVYFILYKPAGVVTTLKDPQGRPTVGALVSGIERRVFPVGRLDYDAEGALLLTDDGELALRLTHPRFGIQRTYLAKVKGVPQEEALARLRQGVPLEDGPARPRSVERFEEADRNTWLKLTVAEGRPHLIKRLCAAVGHPVLRLFRPAHAGIGVESLRPGQWRRLSPPEVDQLQSTAQGRVPPEPPLRLPARRHGRSSDDNAEARPAPRRSVGVRKGKTRGDAPRRRW
jgi:23S rRNA pseudouridine2605 synthase